MPAVVKCVRTLLYCSHDALKLSYFQIRFRILKRGGFLYLDEESGWQTLSESVSKHSTSRVIAACAIRFPTTEYDQN